MDRWLSSVPESREFFGASSARQAPIKSQALIQALGTEYIESIFEVPASTATDPQLLPGYAAQPVAYRAQVQRPYPAQADTWQPAQGSDRQPQDLSVHRREVVSAANYPAPSAASHLQYKAAR